MQYNMVTMVTGRRQTKAASGERRAARNNTAFNTQGMREKFRKKAGNNKEGRRRE
jgi:hypothetical protein